MSIQRNTEAGFTLVELMIVVAIIGILAALAIIGVTKYMANAKTSEARNAIGRMAKDASTAYSREHMQSSVLPAGTNAGLSNQLCGSATAPVPAAMSSVQGAKYQSTAAEWTKGDDNTGWPCLRFSMDQPQYYQYNYQAYSSAATNGSFQAIAQGDLNGNGTSSSFIMNGSVDNGRVILAPNLQITNPDE